VPKLLGPILIFIAAVALFAAAGRLPVVPVPGQLGPDFWPKVVLVGLMASSLLKILEVRAAGREVWKRQSADPARAFPMNFPKLGGGISFVIGYAALTPLIGFPLTNLLFLAAFMWLAGLRRPVPLLVTSTLGTVILLYLFVKVVYLPLPKGGGAMEDFTIFLYRLLGIF
jgi:hypothetical protein